MGDGLKFKRLGETNYNEWVIYMEAALMRRGLMDVINGMKTRPLSSASVKAVIAFLKMQAKAHAKIILHLESLQLPHIHNCDLKVVWDKLAAVHQAHGFATHLMLHQKFLFLKKDPV